MGGVWYRVKEYYFDSRREGFQKTDAEYAEALRAVWPETRPITAVIVDPSAASFLEVLRREGWRVQKAVNEVLSGIRLTADLLKEGPAGAVQLLSRLPAGDDALCLGREGRPRRGEKGTRPRHGRHALLCLDGVGRPRGQFCRLCAGAQTAHLRKRKVEVSI